MEGFCMAGQMRSALWLATVAACLAAACSARAAENLDIPVVLPLTGGAAFLGQGERDALKIQQDMVNARGGLNGTNVRYVFYDDQSSPQIAVQLANQIAAQKPSVIIGSAIVAMCNAMTPMLAKGPVLYCLSPGIFPPSGSTVFTSFISTHDLAIALVRYYRGRGFVRLGMITSTDASGQDGARAFEEALRLPENKDLQMVAAAKFSPSDVSVSAQVEQIKSSGAQALVVWTSGAPFGTVLKGIAQSGLDIPVGTTDANMTYAQMQQYASFLPKEALFMSSQWPPTKGESKVDPAVKAAKDDMHKAFDAAGAKPDIAAALAWDPGLLVLDAYRKSGVGSTSEQIRASIAGTVGWAGINGIYNFDKRPQRGLDVMDCVVTRWMPDTKTWTIVSDAGGGLM
jgi:branched-chain amino acid transport system substrate-binding protein